MAKKKTKLNAKSLGIGAAALIGLGLIFGGNGDEKPEPKATEAPERAVETAAPTPRPSPTATPYRIHGMDPARTVYVSQSGVIHIEKDCSGMKHYTEMSLEDADAAGYEYCSKCVW